MASEPAHMWAFWRDGKGPKDALTTYFPETLAADPRLQVALAMIQNAEIALDVVFAERAAQEREDT